MYRSYICFIKVRKAQQGVSIHSTTLAKQSKAMKKEKEEEKAKEKYMSARKSHLAPSIGRAEAFSRNASQHGRVLVINHLNDAKHAILSVADVITEVLRRVTSGLQRSSSS